MTETHACLVLIGDDEARIVDACDYDDREFDIATTWKKHSDTPDVAVLAAAPSSGQDQNPEGQEFLIRGLHFARKSFRDDTVRNALLIGARSKEDLPMGMPRAAALILVEIFVSVTRGGEPGEVKQLRERAAIILGVCKKK
jgi:hypothetical protein